MASRIEPKMVEFCNLCGKEGVLGIDIVLSTGHEVGSQRPTIRYSCRDTTKCDARRNAKNLPKKPMTVAK